MKLALCTNVGTVQQHFDCDEDRAEMWIHRMRAALRSRNFWWVTTVVEESTWEAWHAGQFGRGLTFAGHLPLGLVVLMAPSVATQDQIDALWTLIRANEI